MRKWDRFSYKNNNIQQNCATVVKNYPKNCTKYLSEVIVTTTSEMESYAYKISMTIPHCYLQRVNFTPVPEEKHEVKFTAFTEFGNSLCLSHTEFLKDIVFFRVKTI